jgi:xanthine dehydrogenase accessory factor
VLVTELLRPLALRRLVCAAEAVYAGVSHIEEIRGRRVEDVGGVFDVIEAGELPVLVDPEAACVDAVRPLVIVDGRMRKIPPERGLDLAPLVIGLGPGFVAGQDCHAVVETNRGHHMGRVFWRGSAQADTAVPEPVIGIDADRVLRAPKRGVMHGLAPLGSLVGAGQPVFRVGDETVLAPFAGAVRGLLHDGLEVEAGVKVGDLDPRGVVSFCAEISDKALAVGGGVLEAILSRPELRRQLAG